ncbi:MAG: hypothetical protein IKO41_12135 [Lachnospiraceae bacterium]|nr:hypothetical protein [Lachnospiraceae bacterium]MBR4606957.1 hypothetical protein [Lachnospiraceae bacterium]
MKNRIREKNSKAEKQRFCQRMGNLAMVTILCFVTLALGACTNTKKEENGQGEKDSAWDKVTKVFQKDKSDGPEDTPWNHGTSAIMETELGWYTTGLGEEMCLRYYEKESGDTIVLCNKPECEHNGNDNCEATYHNLKVVNACLYEGYIYLLGWEGVVDNVYSIQNNNELADSDQINYSLYRAALDGSAIDKIATIFETDNVQLQKVNPSRRVTGAYWYHNDDASFIIHKGVAYVPLYIGLGDGSIGLRGAGFYKVDLSTGTVKEIEKYETLQSRPPAYLCGISDYVYYYRYDGASRKQLWYRYVISEDRVEAADPRLDKLADTTEVFGKKLEALEARPSFTEDREYYLVRTYQEREAGQLAVLAFDAKTQKLLPEESFETEIPFDRKKYPLEIRYRGYYSFMSYDGKFYIEDEYHVFAFDKDGKKAGEIAVPREKLQWNDAERQIYLDFKICNEKLYLIYGNSLGSVYYNNGTGNTGYYYRVLTCPLDGIYQGNGQWTDAYRFQGIMTWKECLLDMIDRLVEGLPEDILLQDLDPREYYTRQINELYPGVLDNE